MKKKIELFSTLRSQHYLNKHLKVLGKNSIHINSILVSGLFYKVVLNLENKVNIYSGFMLHFHNVIYRY